MQYALQSQVTQDGTLLPIYFPADLPNMSMFGEVSLSGKNPQAMASAMTEFIVTCAPCQDELKKFGMVYLGSGSSDVYELLTTKPVRTAADLKGLRLRSGGAPWGRWAEHFDAVPAQMSVFDQFEAVSQGVIDGTMASIADLVSFRMVEVVKYVTYVPLGTYHATSDFTVAAASWASLSADERAAMARAANRANADFTDRWGREMPAEAEAAAKAAGIEFIEADPSLVEAMNAFATADVTTAGELSQKNFGIADAPDRIARFMALVDKWTAIAEAANNDPVAIAAKVQEEVWSKVDYATYGM
jgi:TRAP-type mannitol/chloroaromatic compound transport system substrate-binding protein